MCSIMDSLKMVCDPNDPSDKKTLLLAQLVENLVKNSNNDSKKRNEEVSERIDKVCDHLDELHQNVNKLTKAVNQTIDDRKTCPVYSTTGSDRKNLEQLFFLVKNPKLFLLTLLIGIILAGMGIKDIIIQILTVIK